MLFFKIWIAVIALLTAGLVQAGPYEDGLAAHAKGDYATALRAFRAAAEAGSIPAQTALGIMYDNGDGVAKDKQQAFFWKRKAAEQGDVASQTDLGYMYGNGDGVAKDEQQALFWLRKAAVQGNAHAEFNLGIMYEYGRGVAKDNQRAVFWYRKAADQGDVEAQYNLGLMYAEGRGVQKDDQQAYFWWLLSSVGNHSGSVKNRDIVAAKLNPQQRAGAQEQARDWKPRKQ